MDAGRITAERAPSRRRSYLFWRGIVSVATVRVQPPVMKGEGELRVAPVVFCHVRTAVRAHVPGEGFEPPKPKQPSYSRIPLAGLGYPGRVSYEVTPDNT